MTSSLNTQSVVVAAIQTRFSTDIAANVKQVSDYVVTAAKQGAQIILPSELFESIYFCKEEKDYYFELAKPFEHHPTIEHFSRLAKQLKVAIPVSFFEQDGPYYYNSLAMVDADGQILGVYRKSHIPDGPGYEEKFYFRQGNTGFKVWPTQFGVIGVGICWDQWFPECARAMMLQGADLLFYPTAIGSEPGYPELNTKNMWQRAMIGHAVSNAVPVIAANRIGVEGEQIFYGHSFITDHQGNFLAELPSDQSGVITARIDIAAVRRHRASFGLFRDRRPDLYSILLT